MTYLNLKPVEFDAMGKKNQAAFKWAGRILLPKYDGCFAMVAFHNGLPDFIMSRTGELVKSMDHVYEALFTAYPWLAQSPGGWMVLGEAWNPGKEFADLSGEFRRQYPQPQLGFAPFDLVRYERHAPTDLPVLWSNHPYRERLNELENARIVLSNLVFAPVPAICESREHAERYARCLKDAGGYDGAICSDPEAAYIPGSGKGGEFIKVKPLLSYSLECIGFKKDVGAKTGRDTCALTVRFKEGKPLGVATGLSEAQQAHPEQFVGKIIEVEAMGVSSKGLLREPRFKGVRTDVVKADY